jgi:hypothetical protein
MTGGDSGLAEVADAGISAAPHWEQKRALGSTSVLQRMHRGAKRFTAITAKMPAGRIFGLAAQAAHRTTNLSDELKLK